MAARFIQVLTIGLFSLTLIACGDTPEEKAQDNAKNLIAQHKTLANELVAYGPPSIDWSDEKLNTYESKLNRFEAIELKLAHLNHTNGIIIIGGNSSDFISQARQLIALIRTAKGQKVNTANTPQKNETAQEKFNRLRLASQSIVSEIMLDGLPNTSWTEEELTENIEGTKELIALADEMMAILTDPKTDISPTLRTELIEDLLRAKESSQEMLKTYERIYKEKKEGVTIKA